jgi:hypothetical protein
LVSLFIVVFSLLAAAGLATAAAAAGAPTPTVRNAPDGQQGFPFMTTTLNLAKLGYVEQEFLLSGTAQAYIPLTSEALQPDGRWNVKPNPGATAPYTTRVLVRRPLDPARFNGTVVVEWLNESGGSDATADWFYTHDEIVREGYAWVGVTAQYVGVQALLTWESGPGARYGALVHPGESFAYDIFSQAGRAAAHPPSGDPRPLGNLTSRVHTVLATGFSQSAAWLTTYVNAIHRVSPVYDGFLIHDTGVDGPLSFNFADLFGDPIPDGVPATPDVETPYPFQLRTDQKVPVLVVLSEYGLSDYGQGAGRSLHLQPDTPYIRVWEMAGAPHIESGWLQQLAADAGKSTPGFVLDPCDGPPGIPNLVHGQVARAALSALNGWVSDGAPPRPAPRLSLFVPNPPDDYDQLVAFNRDTATNLALGGIRLPAVAVPVATLNGDRPELDPQTLGPGGQCQFVGSFDPWNHDSDAWDGLAGFDPSPTPEPDLQVLYPTHQNYLLRVTEAALLSIKAGYLRPVDGVQIVQDAAQSHVP